MKKIILIALLFVSCAFSNHYSTTWAGTASNQVVTFYAAADAISTGVFYATSTVITGSTKGMTKSEASTYLNIDATYSPFAAKSAGQLIKKSDLIPGTTVYTHPLYGSAGTTDAATACAAFSTTSGNLYSYVSAGASPANGIVLYTVNTGGTLSSPVSANYTSGYNGILWRGTTKIVFHTDGSSAISGLTLCSSF